MDEVDEEEDRFTGAKKERKLTELEITQINALMMCNSDHTEKWREYYEDERSSARRPRSFPKFQIYMKRKLEELQGMTERGEPIISFPEVTDELRTLVHGPLLTTTTRIAMWSKGRHFRIQELDEKRAGTFDCGITSQFTQDFRSSRHDQNMVTTIVPYYGKIEEIMCIVYNAHTKLDVVLFKYRWFKTNLTGPNATVVVDECGFTRLKTSASSVIRQDWSTSDPFAFPHQVEQCCYVPYPPQPEDWSVIIPYTPRSRCVVQEEPDVIIIENEEQS
jgi:Domain of unknown function (DUF4216)